MSMDSVADLQLYDLPIGEQGFADDPDPYMSAARRQHPWLARSSFGYVLTRYQAINDIMSMDGKLSTPADHIVQIMGGEGTAWGRFQLDNLTARSGTDHSRIRQSVAKAFSPKAVNTYHDRIRQVVIRLLDQWASQPSFDFAQFASNFPVAVMFGLIGAPPTRIPEIKETLEVVGQSFSLDRSIFPKLRKAFDDLWAFVDALVLERLAAARSQGEDLLDELIAARSTEQVNDMELRDLLLFLFVAGYDTSKNQLSHIVNLLLDRPALWARCADDRAYCDKVVAEALRHSGVATSYRNVREHFSYQNVRFPEGTMLIFPLGIACRYSDLFADSAEFNPERCDAKPVLAFGRGMHICLGQFLARLQIAEGLHLITRTLPHARRAGPTIWRLFPGVWGPKHLPIAVGAERAADATT
jgi:cytochrome P450